jgi:hypothetical protein
MYIGTRLAYPKGGYEVSDASTNVAPEVEGVLVSAMRKLLDVSENKDIKMPSEFTEQKRRFGEVTY